MVHLEMDHGHNMDHGGMDMGGDKCSMNMLFTWSSKNLCILFRSWHVQGTFSLVLSLIAIVLLTAGYEGVREISRRYEQSHAAKMASFSNGTPRVITESSSLLRLGKDNQTAAERQGMLIKAALYALQVFYSFFIMLLFMTYNGWVMLAVALGAFVGYINFGSNMTSTKSVACH